MCACVFIGINTSACVSRLLCVGHRTTLGVGPCLPPCLFSTASWLVNFRGFFCFHLLFPHRSNVIPDSFCMSSFYMGPRDLNSGSHACTAGTFTHWTISLAPRFILNLADAFIKVTSSTIRDFYRGWKCNSTYQESSQRALDMRVLKNVCLEEERGKRVFSKGP